MIGARTSDGRRRLNDVEPVHCVARAAQFAAAVKLLHVADMPRAAGKKIGIQRENDIGLFRTVHGVDIAPKGELAPFASAVASSGLPLMPLGAGNLFQDISDLRAKRRRSDRA